MLGVSLLLANLSFWFFADFHLPITFVCLILLFLIKNKLLVIGGFIVGVVLTAYHVHQVFAGGLPKTIENTSVDVVGKVVSVPTNAHGVQSFILSVEKTLTPVVWKLPARVQLKSYRSSVTYKEGERWQLCVKLKQPRSLLNPGGYDRERTYFQNRIVAIGEIVHSDKQVLLSSGGFMPRVRDRIRAEFDRQTSLRFIGISKALSLGDQQSITPKQWEVLRQTGTIHLMAISGLHISLVYGLAWFVFARFRLRRSAPVLCLVLTFCYVWLSGFSLPAVRALVMISLISVYRCYKRQHSPWQAYSMALGGIVIWDPLSTLSIGFWLSFVAVGSLIFASNYRIKKDKRVFQWLHTQYGLFWGLFPFLLLWFSQVPVLSPVANAIAIPWVSFLIVPLVLSGCVGVLVHEYLGYLAWSAADFLLGLLWPLLVWIGKRQFALVSCTLDEPILFCLILLGCVLLVLPKGFGIKGVALLCFLPLVRSGAGVTNGTALVTVLDVGQGLAVVIETAQHVVVFDTGPRGAGKQVILPFLAARQHRSIDTLVVSHTDIDHSGGVVSLLNAMPVHEVLTSDPSFFPPDLAKKCERGQTWEWDGLSFSFLHPEGEVGSKNNLSCVLRISAGADSVLLSADIEQKIESALVSRDRGELRSRVLVVPHHGAKSSSSDVFIQAVAPTDAIISSGYSNRYGHPHSEVLARYEKNEIRVWNTSKSGAITFQLNVKAHQLMGHRQKRKLVWRRPSD